MSVRKDTEESEIEISNDIEQLLVNKINECFSNDNFLELPISLLFRVVKKSVNEQCLSNDKLFDFIKKSINKFCVLFQFLDLQKLSENRLIELCDIYSKSDQQGKLHFNYLGCNLNKMREMIEKLNKLKEEQNGSMKELEAAVASLKKQLSDSEKSKGEIEERNKQMIQRNEDQMKELERKIKELQDKLTDTERENRDLNEKLRKELNSIKGVVKAKVKNGLLISAQIKMIANGVSLDTSWSKFIISKSDAETVGVQAYEDGVPITSLEMETGDFLVKSGKYFVRCLVFDSEGKSSEIVSNAVTTRGESAVFNCEGQSEISLWEGQYKLEVWGAKGGDSTGKGNIDYERSGSPLVEGGLGGYSRGILRLCKKETLHVFVGGEGLTGKPNDGDTTRGGFPDGGGTKTGHYNGALTVPGTGGGSTSIRIGSVSDYARVIVAGGGGGASADSFYISPGGFGGGKTGGNCFYKHQLQSQGAGTQTGSTCGVGYNSQSQGTAGKFGVGASGGYGSGHDSGGGGGGGWYGGGSGGQGWSFEASSGGGGSGWTFTESNFSSWRSGDPSKASEFLLSDSFYLTDSATFSGNEEFPRPDGNGTERGHRGRGFAKITPQ